MDGPNQPRVGCTHQKVDGERLGGPSARTRQLEQRQQTTVPVSILYLVPANRIGYVVFYGCDPYGGSTAFPADGPFPVLLSFLSIIAGPIHRLPLAGSFKTGNAVGNR